METHYAESLESNLDGTRNLALACREAGCYLVYVSTNAVFDGSSAPYRESDPVRSVNKYGQIKIECEKLVSQLLNRYEFALKVAKVFGLDVSLIRPVESSFFPSIAPRPKNTSFVTERVEQELELEPWDVERGLHSMKSRMRVRI